MKEMDGLEEPAPQAESSRLSRRRPFNRREELLTAECAENAEKTFITTEHIESTEKSFFITEQTF
jgi:hypothetical protein